MKRRRGALPGDGAGRQPPGPPLRRQVHDLPGGRARARRARSARSRPASSPTWCCGTRRSSACGRTLVLKGGMIAWAAMGDANASIPTPQPVLPRPMFGAYGAAPAATSRRTSSPRRRSRTASPTGSRVRRRLVAGRATPAGVGKADMPSNDALPRIEVDRHVHRPDRRRGGRSRRRRPSCRWPSATSSSDGPCSPRCSLLADARLPGRRPRALRRARGGGRRRAGCTTWPTLARVPARAGCAPPGWSRRRCAAAAARGRARPPTGRAGRRGSTPGPRPPALRAGVAGPGRGAAAHRSRLACPAAAVAALRALPRVHHPLALGAAAAAAGAGPAEAAALRRCTTSSAGRPPRRCGCSASTRCAVARRRSPASRATADRRGRRRRARSARAAVAAGDPALLPTERHAP